MACNQGVRERKIKSYIFQALSRGDILPFPQISSLFFSRTFLDVNFHCRSRTARLALARSAISCPPAMPPAKKRKHGAGDAAGPSSVKGKAPAGPSLAPDAAAADSSEDDDDQAYAHGADELEDDLEGLVGEVLNGEIADEDAADGASHSAVEVLRSGFEPVLVEDERTKEQCEDGHAHCEAGNPEEVAQWLISPCDLNDFMRHNWERRPLYVSRNNNKGYYDGLLSKNNIEEWIAKGKMRYGVNVDVTSYINGVRNTHNSNDDGNGGADADGITGVADSKSIWNKFEKEKCSLRVLHPQRWRDALWKMLSSLETFWQCSTGCNVYLTPPDSQGFSPHFDDIDAFVLQLEGKKLWKVYAPRSEEEMLPRYSSPNFTQDEIGEPVLEVVLEAGDLLYMPRGTVHQAMCVDGAHSLHVTVSTNQFNTWADVLELAFPAALAKAVEEVPALRRCPPSDFLKHLGLAAQGEVEGDEGEDEPSQSLDEPSTTRRDALLGVLGELAQTVMRRLPFDSAADQLGARLMKQRLPPPPSHLMSAMNATGPGAAERVTDKSVVRVMQENSTRLTMEHDAVAVYHSFANGRLYHMEGGEDEDEADVKKENDGNNDSDDSDEEPGVLYFDPSTGPALEILLNDEHAVEEGVEVEDLPLWPSDVKLEVVKSLVAAGVLAVLR